MAHIAVKTGLKRHRNLRTTSSPIVRQNGVDRVATRSHPPRCQSSQKAQDEENGEDDAERLVVDVGLDCSEEGDEESNHDEIGGYLVGDNFAGESMNGFVVISLLHSLQREVIRLIRSRSHTK